MEEVMKLNIYHVHFDDNKVITEVEYIMRGGLNKPVVLWNDDKIISLYAIDELHAFSRAMKWLKARS